MADLKNMNDKLNAIEGIAKNPPIDMISMNERIENIENKQIELLNLSNVPKLSIGLNQSKSQEIYTLDNDTKVFGFVELQINPKGGSTKTVKEEKINPTTDNFNISGTYVSGGANISISLKRENNKLILSAKNYEVSGTSPIGLSGYLMFFK